ncbi:MAG: PTS glucose transporter subunit IIA [Bacillota bacterium]
MKQIFGYCEGENVAIEGVPDPVFAEKMLGDGFAIVPSGDSGFITAPFDAKIILVAGTKHAIGFTDADGNEFLIHIGIDTVKLDGEGFEILIEADADVKKGDTLAKVDWKFLKSKGLDCSVMLINTDYALTDIKKIDCTIATCDVLIGEY